jgi:hypothetical protein
VLQRLQALNLSAENYSEYKKISPEID